MIDRVRNVVTWTARIARIAMPVRAARSARAARIVGIMLTVMLVPASHTAAPAAPGFQRDVLPIFETRCASCHMVGDPQGGLVLEREYAYAMIVGVPSVESPLKRVEPGAPDRSYLYRKLTFAYRDVGGTGWNMPIGFMPLGASELDIVRRWIAAGAPND